MKVFISWSGARSNAIAKALHDWIPSVIQVVRPFMSEEDIRKGSRWAVEIAAQLKDARIGLICLTPENLEAPWILFEAGALSNKLGDLVCTYLFELQPGDVREPLGQFNATKAEKEDTRKLMHTINGALDQGALSQSQLDGAFEMWWSELEKVLANIPDPEEKPAVQRDEREMIEEILEIARGLARQESTERASKTTLQTALQAEAQRQGMLTRLGLTGTPTARMPLIGEYLESDLPPTDPTGGPKST